MKKGLISEFVQGLKFYRHGPAAMAEMEVGAMDRESSAWREGTDGEKGSARELERESAFGRRGAVEEPWPAERHGQAGEVAGRPWEQGSRAGEMTAMGGACCCREGEGGRRGEEGSRAGGLPFKEALAAAIGGRGRQCCRAPICTATEEGTHWTNVFGIFCLDSDPDHCRRFVPWCILYKSCIGLEVIRALGRELQTHENWFVSGLEISGNS
jgi:hypothetical protein